MEYLIIEVKPKVTLGVLKAHPGAQLEWNGQTYTQVLVPDNEPVFFDWVRSYEGHIVGIELYIWNEHPIVLQGLRASNNNSNLDGTQILFSSDDDGTCDGTQGFGDIHFFCSASNQWVVAVGTELWLKPEDKIWLDEIARVNGS